jgi:AP-1 complex subunit mu
MSGPSAIFILDQKGKVIIWRNYRGDVVSATVVDRFAINVVEAAEDALIKPVFTENGFCYAWIKVNNLYVLSVSSKFNANAMMILSYLHKLVEVLKDYFKSFEEESIKDNFVLIYELMDEMMDNGIPQTTEVKVLRDFIKTESHELSIEKMKAPTAMTNAVSWRSEGIKYKKNEIFLDVVEKLNLLVSANGQVLRSEIIGTLKMKSLLSGMPELKLGLNDKILLEGGQANNPSTSKSPMEDIKFHQCVRLSRYENDRTISFIPPDGDFELMSYRLNTQVKPLFWVETVVDRTKGRSRIEFMVKARSQYKSRSIANNVEILVPVPADSDTPQFNTSIGTAKYLPEKDMLVWSIKQFPGQQDFIMTATFGLPSVAADNRDAFLKIPIQVKFEIPYFTVSGLTVKYLKIVEKSGYQSLPWVRYITVDGEYQLKMV